MSKMDTGVNTRESSSITSLDSTSRQEPGEENSFPEVMAIRRPKISTNPWKLLQEFDTNVSNGNVDSHAIQGICSFLKNHGKSLDEGSGRTQLDSYFNEYRNLIRSNQLDLLSKCHLLELIELRGAKWNANQEVTDFYHNHRRNLERKKSHQSSSVSSRNSSKDSSTTGDESEEGSTGHHNSGKALELQRQPSFKNRSILKSNSSKVLTSQQNQTSNYSSGGKNLVKEELIIRNSDSGKVMGIKGRRVKMIEEMSDTIISFQRVVPGVRDRLLQITGTRNESIDKAKQLILDTILRNCSPTPDQQPPPTTRLTSFSSGNTKGLGSGLQRSSSLGHALIKKRGGSDEYFLTESVATGNPDQALKVSANSAGLLREAVHALKSHFEMKKNLKRYLPEFEFEFGDSDDEGRDHEDASEDNSLADSEDFEVKDILKKQEKEDKQRQVLQNNDDGKKSLEKEPIDSFESFQLPSHVSRPNPLQSIVAPCDVLSSPDEEEHRITREKREVLSPKSRISYTKDFLMDCSKSSLSQTLPDNFIENREELSSIMKETGNHHKHKPDEDQSKNPGDYDDKCVTNGVQSSSLGEKCKIDQTPEAKQ